MRIPLLAAALLTATSVGLQPANAAEYTIYTFEVSAGESTPHALSHIEFKFTEEGSAIMAPYGETLNIDRKTTSGTEKIQYVVVQDDNDIIKFEDATEGLGEDKATETDTFHVYLRDSDSPSVVVTTKASTGEIDTVITVEEGASITDALGFTIKLVAITVEGDESPAYD